MTGVVPSGIAIIVSLFLLIFLVMKGLNLIPTAILCAVFMSFFVEGGISVGLMETFTSGVGSLAADYILPMMFAGIFAGLMSASGCDLAFGRKLVSLFGDKAAVYGLSLFVFIICACGVTSYIFVTAILAFPILRASNLPRNVGVIIMQGVAGAAMFMMPGSIATINILVAQMFGVTLFAGGWIGLVMAIFLMVFTLGYLQIFVIPKYRREGVGYTDTPMEETLKGRFATVPDDQLPSFWVSALPLIVLVISTVILQFVIQVGVALAGCMGLLIGSLMIIILCWKNVSKKILFAVGHGCETACGPFVMICAVAGYGTVITSTAAYNWLIEVVTEMNMNPYLMVVLGTIMLAGICGDSGSSLVISASAVCERAIAMGAKAGYVTRLAMAASTTLNSLPHSSNVAVTISFMGLTHKECYHQIAVVQILGTLLATFLGLGLVLLFG